MVRHVSDNLEVFRAVVRLKFLCFKKYICSVDGVKSNNIHTVKGSFGLSLDIKDSRKLHKGIRNGVRLPKGKREMLRSR